MYVSKGRTEAKIGSKSLKQQVPLARLGNETEYPAHAFYDPRNTARKMALENVI
jgi:hypothetical protein